MHMKAVHTTFFSNIFHTTYGNLQKNMGNSGVTGVSMVYFFTFNMYICSLPLDLKFPLVLFLLETLPYRLLA